jgi:hypothetical protein
MAISAAILFPIAVDAQQNSTQNSGDCTILVQGNNNNVTISAPCSPTKTPRLITTSATGPSEKSSLQFTIREFVIDPHTRMVFASIGVINHSQEEVLLQFVTRESSLELSDPPASIPIRQVQGLGTCHSNMPLRICLDRASDIDFTSISPSQSMSFRVSGLVRIRNGIVASNGTLSFLFLRKVGAKYEKLNVSFSDVKLTESQ